MNEKRPLILDTHEIFEIIKREKTLAASYKAIMECSFEGKVCLDEEDKKSLSKALRELSLSLKESSIKFWIDWGSFLGAYRDKSIIPWDKDFDIGILSKDRKKFVEIIEKSDSLSIKKENETENYINLKVEELGTTWIDVNLSDRIESSSGVFLNDRVTRERSYSFFKELDSIFFEDLNLSMPCPNLSKAEELLSSMYGKDFMLPPGNPLVDSKGKLWIDNKGGN